MYHSARIAPGPRSMCPAGLPVSTTWRLAQKRSYEEICSKNNEKFTIITINIDVFVRSTDTKPVRRTRDRNYHTQLAKDYFRPKPSSSLTPVAFLI